MNKVLIISDSHGLTDKIETIKNRHRVDKYLHCGDSELSIDSPKLNKMVVVKGNCDWKADFPLYRVVEIGGLRIFLTHGHLFDVKKSLLALKYKAEEVHADIVCFGHSHIPYAENIDDFLFINPGSIRSPRKFTKPSYVLMEWEKVEKIKITFYHVNGEVIKNFPFPTDFNLKNSVDY